MDFIEFVTGLAPEGETVLFVHQKGGGYIPQLPSVRRRAGGAWYVSSGSFILDRMTDGLSASTSNCTTSRSSPSMTLAPRARYRRCRRRGLSKPHPATTNGRGC